MARGKVPETQGGQGTASRTSGIKKGRTPDMGAIQVRSKEKEMNGERLGIGTPSTEEKADRRESVKR